MIDTMTIQDKTYNNKGKTMTNKQWVEKNRDRLKKYQAEYYLNNIDKLKAYKRNWYQSTRKENK
jgi:cell fate (sporulation/competence/biofilm development) regulator YmcA (YheA/YmcA/DUF963 family)